MEAKACIAAFIVADCAIEFCKITDPSLQTQSAADTLDNVL